MGKKQLHFALQPSAHVAGAADDRPVLVDVVDRGLVHQRVARNGRDVEAGLGHLGQHHPLLKRAVFGHQQPAGLREPLDDQRIGHHRRPGKVIVQVLFGQGDVFDGRGGATTFELGITVDPEPTHSIPRMKAEG